LLDWLLREARVYEFFQNIALLLWISFAISSVMYLGLFAYDRFMTAEAENE
jgi:hypothetical protein